MEDEKKSDTNSTESQEETEEETKEEKNKESKKEYNEDIFFCPYANCLKQYPNKNLCFTYSSSCNLSYMFLFFIVILICKYFMNYFCQIFSMLHSIHSLLNSLQIKVHQLIDITNKTNCGNSCLKEPFDKIERNERSERKEDMNLKNIVHIMENLESLFKV
jgi:hypothetical protein